MFSLLTLQFVSFLPTRYLLNSLIQAPPSPSDDPLISQGPWIQRPGCDHLCLYHLDWSSYFLIFAFLFSISFLLSATYSVRDSQCCLRNFSLVFLSQYMIFLERPGPPFGAPSVSLLDVCSCFMVAIFFLFKSIEIRVFFSLQSHCFLWAVSVYICFDLYFS